MTRPIFTGSMVGVIAAETMAMTRTAIRHWAARVFALINPIFARANITKGNSNAMPIQNIIPVTNLTYEDGRGTVEMPMKLIRKGRAVGIMT